MNKMLGYLKDYKRESVLAPLFKMLEATFDLFVPLVMADIVNIGIAAHDFHYILVPMDSRYSRRLFPGKFVVPLKHICSRKCAKPRWLSSSRIEPTFCAM